MHNIRKDRLCFLIFIVVILLVVVIFIFTKDNKKNNEIKYRAIITDNSEQNSLKVKEYFVNGMSTLDYKNTIEKQDDYVTKKGKYQKIYYNFEKQLSYEELEKIYENLSLSNIVKLEIIGTSTDGRNLYAIEIGSGENVTMFEASIHAAEVASTLFITKYMVDLVNGYEDGDKDTIELLKNNKIVIIPCANPDGYETAIFGTKSLNNQNLYIALNADSDSLKYIKTNANGIDLNRNFPSQTSGLYYTNYSLHSTVSLTKSVDRLSYYPGQTLGSEPETRAIMYIQNKWISKIKSYVALHSAGRVIYNGKPFLSDEYNNTSYNCAKIVGDITGYTTLDKSYEEAGEGNDGTSTEYMAESLSGFIFSSKTGRLSSDYYAQKYTDMKYPNTCVIVIESLENYTIDLDVIKEEYYDYDLEKAYSAIINR